MIIYFLLLYNFHSVVDFPTGNLIKCNNQCKFSGLVYKTRARGHAHTKQKKSKQTNTNCFIVWLHWDLHVKTIFLSGDQSPGATAVLSTWILKDHLFITKRDLRSTWKSYYAWKSSEYLISKPIMKSASWIASWLERLHVLVLIWYILQFYISFCHHID